MNLIKLLFFLGIAIVVYSNLIADFYVSNSKGEDSHHTNLRGRLPYGYQITIKFLEDNYTSIHQQNKGSYPILVTVKQKEQVLTVGQLKQVNMTYDGVISTTDNRLKGEVQVIRTVTARGTTTIKELKEGIRKQATEAIIEKINNL